MGKLVGSTLLVKDKTINIVKNKICQFLQVCKTGRRQS